MAFAASFLVIGVIGLLISKNITEKAWEKAGLAQASVEELKATAGTGIVPKYVSFINLASWFALILGIIGVVRWIGGG